MENLYLDNKPWSYFKFGMGILSLVAAISVLFADFGNYRSLDYFLIFIFILTGIMHMTNDFGTQKTYLRHDSGNLTIKWFNFPRPRTINFKMIESIYLKRTEIIINRNSTKPVRLNLSAFSTQQKKDLYNFFIGLSRSFELKLIRQFEG